MNAIYNLGAAWFGAVLGLLAWSRTVRWGYAAWLAVKARGKPDTSQPGAMPTWLLFLHPGPWLTAILIFIAWHILSAPHHPAWNWAFGGAVAGPLIAVPLSLLMLQRARAGATKRAQP